MANEIDNKPAPSIAQLVVLGVCTCVGSLVAGVTAFAVVFGGGMFLFCTAAAAIPTGFTKALEAQSTHQFAKEAEPLGQAFGGAAVLVVFFGFVAVSFVSWVVAKLK